MNRSVPTLLGIAILLLVVVLAVLLYNIQLTKQLATGATVVGTVGGEKLTGVDQPNAELDPGRGIGQGATAEEAASGAELQQKRLGKGKVTQKQERGEARREERPATESQEPQKPGK